jgi:hypothetical protein
VHRDVHQERPAGPEDLATSRQFASASAAASRCWKTWVEKTASADLSSSGMVRPSPWCRVTGNPSTTASARAIMPGETSTPWTHWKNWDIGLVSRAAPEPISTQVPGSTPYELHWARKSTQSDSPIA